MQGTEGSLVLFCRKHILCNIPWALAAAIICSFETPFGAVFVTKRGTSWAYYFRHWTLVEWFYISQLLTLCMCKSLAHHHPKGKKTKVKTIGTSMSGLPVAQLFFLIIILRQTKLKDWKEYHNIILSTLNLAKWSFLKKTRSKNYTFNNDGMHHPPSLKVGIIYMYSMGFESWIVCILDCKSTSRKLDFLECALLHPFSILEFHCHSWNCTPQQRLFGEDRIEKQIVVYFHSPL